MRLPGLGLLSEILHRVGLSPALELIAPAIAVLMVMRGLSRRGHWARHGGGTVAAAGDAQEEAHRSKGCDLHGEPPDISTGAVRMGM